MRRLWLLLAILPGIALAIDTGAAFDDPELQARYDKLIDEVRCVVCQNQTIKDSNVFLASDLRGVIRRLIGEGKSDAEIKDYLVARYGEFVLYRPRMQGTTLLLWIAPVVLILGGLFAVVRIIRGRMAMPLDDEADQALS